MKRKRLSIFRSNKYFYVQLIDDIERKTIFSLSTRDVEKKQLSKANLNSFSDRVAKKLLSNNIKTIVFDKGNTTYKQNVSLFADALRSYGIIF